MSRPPRTRVDTAATQIDARIRIATREWVAAGIRIGAGVGIDSGIRIRRSRGTIAVDDDLAGLASNRVVVRDCGGRADDGGCREACANRRQERRECV